MQELIWRGKGALVTGGSSEIGREIARALAARGARVVLSGRSSRRLAEAAEFVGGDTLTFPADLRHFDAIEQLSSFAETELERVDFFVHAAGVWHNGEESYQGPLFADTSIERVQEVLDVGLRAGMLLARRLVPAMASRRAGKLLFVTCGFAGAHEAVGWLHYYTSNLGLENFARGLAAEVRRFDLQVNCVAPWFVATAPVQTLYPDAATTALSPDEIAQAALFLLDTDNVSGQVLELRSKDDHG